MNAIRFAAIGAASVLCLGIGPAWAADPDGLSAMHVAAGQRAASHWTPAAMAAAKLRMLPEVDPAAVRGAAGPQERADKPVRVTNGAMDGSGAAAGTGGGSGNGNGGDIGGLGGSGAGTGGDGGTGGGSGGGSGGGDGGLGGGGGGGGSGGGDGGLGGGVGGGGSGGGDGGLGGGGGGAVADQPQWGGKLFFSAPDGDFVCAAQFVSKNVVLTAAQCLQDDESGQYFQNMRFVQERPGGKQNVFDTECAATFTGWTQPGDERWTYDMGMVLLKGDSPAGWMGLMWNWKSIGQLGVVGSDGRIAPVAGSISVQDGIAQMKRGGGDGLLGGAAWVTATTDDNGALQHAFGLESFTFDNQPGVSYGPYFDDRIKTLFDYASNGCQ